MAFKKFNDLRLFMTDTSPCSTNLFHKKTMGIEDSPYGVGFYCGKARHLDKKLSLPQQFNVLITKLDMQVTKESDFRTLPRQSRTVL